MATLDATAPRAEDRDSGRLARGVLSNFDIAAATLASIAPAMSFYFGFATIVTTAGIAVFLTVVGYIVAVASVVPISGGFTETILNHYLSIKIPWQILSAVLTLGALVLIVGGAKGTILIALTYLTANVALPFYFRRYHRERFSLLLDLILPVLGALAIGYPLYQLVKPGQPAPFNSYPLIAGGVVMAALIYGAIAHARDRSLGERVGSGLADAE
jgi:hypothetical protein